MARNYLHMDVHRVHNMETQSQIRRCMSRCSYIKSWSRPVGLQSVRKQS